MRFQQALGTTNTEGFKIVFPFQTIFSFAHELVEINALQNNPFDLICYKPWDLIFYGMEWNAAYQPAKFGKRTITGVSIHIL